MGVISDAIDALEDWCCDLFKDGIKSQFDGISELLTDTFAQTTGSGAKGNLVSNFLTKHPAQFTGTAGSAPTGYGIWATIETLCNNVVVPIGGFILTVILLNELCQMVIRGNNFKDFDDSIFIKWIIKALCGVILVANTYYIASALFSFGTNVCSNGLATLFGSGEWASIGKNWVKQLLALSFQGFFIVVALGIFKTLFSNMITSLNSSSDGVIMQMAMLMGYTAALIFTILRTGAISKSMFNAH